MDDEAEGRSSRDCPGLGVSGRSAVAVGGITSAGLTVVVVISLI